MRIQQVHIRMASVRLINYINHKQHFTFFFVHTWTSFQLESRLESRDGGDDGSVWHDGSVHIHFLGGGNRGADWQSVMGAARLFCFHIQQLEEPAGKKKNGIFSQ